MLSTLLPPCLALKGLSGQHFWDQPTPGYGTTPTADHPQERPGMREACSAFGGFLNIRFCYGDNGLFQNETAVRDAGFVVFTSFRPPELESSR